MIGTQDVDHRGDTIVATETSVHSGARAARFEQSQRQVRRDVRRSGQALDLPKGLLPANLEAFVALSLDRERAAFRPVGQTGRKGSDALLAADEADSADRAEEKRQGGGKRHDVYVDRASREDISGTLG